MANGKFCMAIVLYIKVTKSQTDLMERPKKKGNWLKAPKRRSRIKKDLGYLDPGINILIIVECSLKYNRMRKPSTGQRGGLNMVMLRLHFVSFTSTLSKP